MKQPLKLRVNGEDHELYVDPRKTLVQVLRDDLLLTGTKEGCSTGYCGACTVIIDDKAVKSSLVLARQVQGRDILTVEGLAQGGKLHPVQQAIIDSFGLQCGFCTPGMIMSLKALFDEKPKASEDEIRTALIGNLCRCTGYKKIVDAGLAVAKNKS